MLIRNDVELTESDWEYQFKPIPNPYRPGMGFDYGSGSCLFLYTDLQRYIKEHNLSDAHIWTVVEDEDDLYISHGYHYVNSLGYIATEIAPRFTLNYDILVE